MYLSKKGLRAHGKEVKKSSPLKCATDEVWTEPEILHYYVSQRISIKSWGAYEKVLSKVYVDK